MAGRFSMTPGRYRIGADIGGTFTDLIALDTITGAQTVGKVLTTPADPSEAVEAVLCDVIAGYVSFEAARRDYAVVIEFNGRPEQLVRLPKYYAIDGPTTRTLRAQ